MFEPDLNIDAIDHAPAIGRARKFIVIYMAILGLLACCGGYAGMRLGLIQHMTHGVHRFVYGNAYYDMPRINVLIGGDTQLRVDMSLEIAAKDANLLQGFQPIMTERLKTYLATLDPDLVKRPEATPWLREQLLQQIKDVGAPVSVQAVIFRQLVIMSTNPV